MSTLIATLIGEFLVVGILAFIAWYVIQAVAKWKIFSKAGESGWKAWIPFYSTYVEYSFTWKTIFFWIWLLLSVVDAFIGQPDGGFQVFAQDICSLIMLVITVMGNYKLSCSFGHGAGFALGLILLNPVFVLILGFGSSEYIGNTSEDYNVM